MSEYVYEKRKQAADVRFGAGVCADCPDWRLPNGWRCESCRKRNADNRKKRYREEQLGKRLCGGLGTDE